ncbi:YopX family protein [Lacticaseibacillus yichunensis]|uniref:YopX family protein n=1 Tax=Lacticaseibacillus yichunensis TaxID=2486015 RepID=A0ABW4CKJ1_9LACO|nr:YopX family protein [Lacticaseibacillus yichunensis]
MREIKFRAWMPYNEDPNDMRMEYYPQLFAEDGNGIFNINSAFAHQIDYFADNGTYPEAVIKFMQYTGLHDENGREIYEGDIVKLHQVVLSPDDTIGWVEYTAQYGYSIRFGKRRCRQSDWATDEGANYEVIGNIFENPELLEESK